MVRQAQDSDLTAAVSVVSYARAGNDERRPRRPLELSEWSRVRTKCSTQPLQRVGVISSLFLGGPSSGGKSVVPALVVSSPTGERTNVHETKVCSGFRSRSDQIRT